jgi:hypothetical protein
MSELFAPNSELRAPTSEQITPNSELRTPTSELFAPNSELGTPTSEKFARKSEKISPTRIYEPVETLRVSATCFLMVSGYGLGLAGGALALGKRVLSSSWTAFVSGISRRSHLQIPLMYQ